MAAPAEPRYSIRALDLATDAPALAALLGHLWPVALTAQEVSAREPGEIAEGELERRVVAVQAGGEVVGLGEASRSPWAPPGDFWVAVVVDPAHRQRGLGSRLFQDVADFARAHGGAVAHGYVRDDRPAALAFAGRHGLAVQGHEFSSTLDLRRFDEAPFASAVERAERAGFRFFSLADVPDAADAPRRLYAVHRATAADVPGSEHEAFPPFERYQTGAVHGRASRPEGLIVAQDAASGEWVGLTIVSAARRAGGAAYNAHTGVLRAYRGRGLAQALKVLAIRAARDTFGARTLRTDNDEHNAPMLTINRKLGYQPQPGWYRVAGPLVG